VIVDDIDSLDLGSAEAFAFVGRRLMAEGIALMIAARPSGASITEGLPRCPVRGLDGSDVAELIRDRHVPGARADAGQAHRTCAVRPPRRGVHGGGALGVAPPSALRSPRPGSS
jgi:hypothetical protein